MNRQENTTDATITTYSRAASILTEAGTIAVNCCKILFFLALGALFMIYS